MIISTKPLIMSEFIIMPRLLSKLNEITIMDW